MGNKVLFVAPAKLYPVDAEGKPIQQVRENVSIPALTVLGSLKSAGFDVDFMDLSADGYENQVQYGKNTYRFGLPDEAVVERIRNTHPMALLVTSMFSTEQVMVDDLTSAVKSANPQLPIIVGGANASLDPSSVLRSSSIDFIVLGEAEETIPSLLNDIYHDGIGPVKDKRTRIVEATRLSDINRPWALDEVLLRDGEYRYNDDVSRRSRTYAHLTEVGWSKSFALYYSRGCPTHCDYCTASEKDGNAIRHMGSERMFADLRLLHESYGMQVFYNQADSFCRSQEDLAFLRKVKDYRKEHQDFVINNPNAFLVGTFFPSSLGYELDESLLDLLAGSGFNVITLAVETFNQRFNRKIDFGEINPQKINDLLSAVHGRGMKAELYMMYAFPDETKEEFAYDQRIVDSLQCVDEVAWQSCMVFPGTTYYRQGLKQGWFTEESYQAALKQGYFFHHLPEAFNFSRIPYRELEAFRKVHKPNV